ncbi:MAG: membrane dipeptidase, partial [Pyrinomonadaceae bacterium]
MMTRLFTALLLASLTFGPTTLLAQSSTDEAALIAKARKIHDKVITLDTHNDINVANFTDKVNYTQDLLNQVNIPKMRKGGLDVSWLIVYTGQGEMNDAAYDRAYKSAIDKFDAIHRLT